LIVEPQTAVDGRTEGEAPALLALNRGLSFIERGLVVVAAGSIFFMMLVLVVDVGGRYLFNRPLAWAYDIISIYLLPLIVYLAIADAYRRNQHISVDMLYNLMDQPKKRLVRLVSAIVVVGVMAPITWLAAGEAISRYQNDVVIAGSILWPTWIPAFFLALGGSLLVLRAILDGVALATALVSGSQTVAGESAERQAELNHHGDAT
jgi:TRAP-type C4-dicarboxylate transport system permease small subunit